MHDGKTSMGDNSRKRRPWCFLLNWPESQDRLPSPEIARRSHNLGEGPCESSKFQELPGSLYFRGLSEVSVVSSSLQERMFLLRRISYTVLCFFLLYSMLSTPLSGMDP